MTPTHNQGGKEEGRGMKNDELPGIIVIIVAMIGGFIVGFGLSNDMWKEKQLAWKEAKQSYDRGVVVYPDDKSMDDLAEKTARKTDREITRPFGCDYRKLNSIMLQEGWTVGVKLNKASPTTRKFVMRIG